MLGIKSSSLLYFVMQDMGLSSLPLNTSMMKMYTLPFRYLDVSHNNIKYVLLEQLTAHLLVLLDISHNHLQSIEKDVFSEVRCLRVLILSHNCISSLENKAFSGTPNLKVVLLEHNYLAQVNTAQLPEANSLSVMTSDLFTICCLYHNAHHCSPLSDSLSSCVHLLDNVVKRATIGILTITSILGNVIALGINSRKCTSEVIFLCSQNLADLLMGLSWGLTSLTDIIYRENIQQILFTWKQHWMCQTIACLQFISSHASLLLTIYITANRVYHVQQLTKHVKGKADIIASVSLWTVSISLAICLTTVFATITLETEMQSNLCPMFSLQQGVWRNTARWTVSLCHVVVNFIGAMVLMGSYVCLARTVWQVSYGSAARASTKSASACGIIRIGVLIVGSLISQGPLLAAYCMTLSDYDIDQDVGEWLLIIIMPILSVLHPFMNTIIPNCQKISGKFC
jgi:hypothetical protein